MKLKLCGIRRIEDVEMLNSARPDYAGFVFWPRSKRYVDPDSAHILSISLNEEIKTVGVFVNEAVAEAARIADVARLSVIQLHGDEDEEYIRALRREFGGEIWKAAGVQSADDVRRACELSADMLLFDAFSPDLRGGTGKRLDLSHIKEAAPERPYFLAGGITALNVRSILSEINPYGLDVSSGFETNGVKDRQKLMEFMEQIVNERM